LKKEHVPTHGGKKVHSALGPCRRVRHFLQVREDLGREQQERPQGREGQVTEGVPTVFADHLLVVRQG
jgi:hypothetical protein